MESINTLTCSEKGKEGLAFSRRELTPREAAVLEWVAFGKSNDEIALLLGIHLCTVKKHLEHIFDKLGVENRTAAASFCWEWLANTQKSAPHPGGAASP